MYNVRVIGIKIARQEQEEWNCNKYTEKVKQKTSVKTNKEQIRVLEMVTRRFFSRRMYLFPHRLVRELRECNLDVL